MDIGDGAVSMYDWVVDRGITVLDYARSFWSFFWSFFWFRGFVGGFWRPRLAGGFVWVGDVGACVREGRGRCGWVHGVCVFVLACVSS